jgi:REP-associated tyrosine transposase
MPRFTRRYVAGGTYLLTLATFERRPLFRDADHVERLRRAVRDVMTEWPFDFLAGVVLPDHAHFLWALPAGETDFSKRVGRVKTRFTQTLPAQDPLRPRIARQAGE